MQLQLGKKRKYLESAFEERTVEMRTLAEYSPGGIFRCDENGSVTYTNPMWHELSGYPTGIEVTQWGDYIHPMHRRMFSDFWETVYSSQELSSSCEWQFVNGRWVTAMSPLLRFDHPLPLSVLVHLAFRNVRDAAKNAPKTAGSSEVQSNDRRRHPSAIDKLPFTGSLRNARCTRTLRGNG
jgi:PAS domain-containing protein